VAPRPAHEHLRDTPKLRICSAVSTCEKWDWHAKMIMGAEGDPS
jgi:hypothetical protein